MVSSVETTLIATDNDNECETKENKNLLAKFSIKTTTATGFGNYGHSKALVQSVNRQVSAFITYLSTTGGSTTTG